MKLKSIPVLLLAVCLLLSSGCGVRIVEKPEPSQPTISVQTPAPTATPAPAPKPTPTPAPTAAPTPAPTPEPTPEPTPAPTEPPANEGYRRGLVSFDEFVYERPDFEAIAADVEAVRAMLTDGSDGQAIHEAYDALDDEFYEIHNAYAIAQIYSALDVTDEYYSSESELIAEKTGELQVVATKLDIAVAESEFRDEVLHDWTEKDFRHLEIAEKLYDDEYVTLSTRLEALKNEYWNAMSAACVEYKGSSYTLAELDSLDLDDGTYYSLMNEGYKNLNASVGALYLELIGIEKRIAEKAGFDSYPAFSYEYEYERDYTPEEAAELAKAVKTYAAAEMQAMYRGFTPGEYAGLNRILNSGDELSRRFDTIDEYVQEISPEMKEAFDYLIEYELSVLTTDENSQEGAYTTYLPTFDVPFIFMHEEENVFDLFTFIHEFGHFYCNYLGGRDAAYDKSLDVNEICSQANEMLFLPCCNRFYKSDTYNAIVKYQMLNALNALVTGCLYDEFQQYVFTHEVTTVEELNEAYRTISESYGIGGDFYYVDLGYVWIDVHHNFAAPMYYISYATSIVPALQIMEISADDRQEAIRIYNGVVSGDPELSFSEALAEAGLASPFEAGTIIDIVNAIVDGTGVGKHVGG